MPAMEGGPEKSGNPFIESAVLDSYRAKGSRGGPDLISG